jgi:hypothetical protein
MFYNLSVSFARPKFARPTCSNIDQGKGLVCKELAMHPMRKPLRFGIPRQSIFHFSGFNSNRTEQFETTQADMLATWGNQLIIQPSAPFSTIEVATVETEPSPCSGSKCEEGTFGQPLEIDGYVRFPMSELFYYTP